jgi:hypothetical protein
LDETVYARMDFANDLLNNFFFVERRDYKANSMGNLGLFRHLATSPACCGSAGGLTSIP